MRYDVGRFRRPMRRSTEGQLMSLISLGDGSTLSLDFTTGVLDPRLTFTRSGTGTFINASGLVATASTNTPRFDYDPTSIGTPRGLLIEGSATNLLNWSESFATSGGTNNNWADTNITRNSTNNADPANGTTALRVTASAGNGTIISTAAMGTSAERTLSIWLRRVSGTGNIQYTLDNGSTYTTQAITSSWVRYTFAATTAAQRVGIRIVTSGDSIELWGAQLETGSGASSYIPTGASQGTRNADNCSIVSPNFAPWFNASAGTLLVSARTATRYVDSAGFDFPAVLTLDSNNHIGPCQWNGVVYGVVRVGGSYRINYATLASPGNNANYKAAIAYADSDYAAVANGGSIQTGSGTTVPSGLNQLALGASRGGIAGNFFGHISQIKFWPTRLPNAQLQSLTT